MLGHDTTSYVIFVVYNNEYLLICAFIVDSSSYIQEIFALFFCFLLVIPANGGKLSFMKKIWLLFCWIYFLLRIPGWAGEVLILATADMHGTMEKMNRLRLLIAQERQRAGGPERVLLIDAGDTLQGSFLACYEAGVLPMAMLRAMGYDFWVPGNHDFEQVPWRFQDFTGTVLGANWHSREFQPESWRLVTRNGVRIAVIGLTEGQLLYRVLPGTLRWEPPEAALRRIMPEVRAVDPDVIVLVQHDGEYFRGGSLRYRLREFPEIDLVIGAHTHQENAGTRIGDAWFVQPGCYAEAVAAVRIDFDECEKSIRRITSELLHPEAAGSVLEDQDMPADMAVALRHAEAQRTHPAGRAPGPLQEPAGKCLGGNLATLIGRAMMQAGAADAAIYAGNSRQRLYPSALREQDLFDLFPFENRICTVALTPEELRAVLEEESRLLRRNRRRAVLLAGMEADITNRGEIILHKLPSPRQDGRIRVAVTDYYLAGSGGLTMTLRQLIERGAPYKNSQMPLRDAVKAQLDPF